MIITRSTIYVKIFKSSVKYVFFLDETIKYLHIILLNIYRKYAIEFLKAIVDLMDILNYCLLVKVLKKVFFLRNEVCGLSYFFVVYIIEIT